MTTAAPTHPADMIKDATTFTKAVECYIAACEYEIRIAVADENWRRCDQWLKNAAQAHMAMTLANMFVREHAIEVMYMTAASDFAEALESGDYSLLAF